MDLLLTNANIVMAEGPARLSSVAVKDGRFDAIGPHLSASPQMRIIDCRGGWLTPGLFDIQVNGGGGVLFNETPTVEGLKTIAKAHQRLGTHWMLPTLISDSLDVVDSGMRAVERAIEEGVCNIAGIHIEGPFLNPDRCGIHDPGRMLQMDDAALDLLSSLKHGRTLVTLAPERVAPDVIRMLVDRDIVVWLGHSNASFEATMAALDAGASGFTHLFNAMPPLKSREPGLVGAALEDRTAWSSIILDGHHVSPVTARLAFRNRPLNKFALITDAMPPAGTELDSFTIQGRRITVGDGQCRDENGVLAGAHLSLPQAISNAVKLCGIPAENAIRMASQYPAECIAPASEFGRIEMGRLANAVLLSKDFHVSGQMIHGEWTQQTVLSA